MLLILAINPTPVLGEKVAVRIIELLYNRFYDVLI